MDNWHLDILLYFYVFDLDNLNWNLHDFINIFDSLLLDNDWLFNVFNLDYWLLDNLLYFYVFNPDTLNWNIDVSITTGDLFTFDDSLNRSVLNFVSDNFVWNFYNPFNCFYVGVQNWDLSFNNDFMILWYIDMLDNFVWAINVPDNFCLMVSWYLNFLDNFSVSVYFNRNIDMPSYMMWNINVLDNFSVMVFCYFNFLDNFSISEYFNLDVSINWHFNVMDDFSLLNNWNLNFVVLYNLFVSVYWNLSFDNLLLSVHWDVVNNISFLVDLFVGTRLMVTSAWLSFMIMMTYFTRSTSA